ncbi:hypothetical protein H0A36_11375 [Endozoicomonas sp. SM1973]|uniref:Uncharacterized protein n=1 Tax=Spartinivicinus marinus TaxID=2994442 RepID=A0A853HXY0_9GAMM|nr:hypothetical protein [Spartinivicinus marinus]MCX4026127.1 hypothetical protein [Spartinivicinus marinus]NYZ66610.1 hypothetical protein [Spartinivicinus marinus]
MFDKNLLKACAIMLTAVCAAFILGTNAENAEYKANSQSSDQHVIELSVNHD